MGLRGGAKRIVFTLLLLNPFHVIAQSLGERDTGFKIVLERRTEKPMGYQAHITTTSTYPCEGYSLKTRVRWYNDTVNVYVLGLLRPSPCIQSSAEASGSVFMGELKEGTSFIRIEYRGDVDLHKVIRSKSRVATRSIRATFTELKGN